MSLLQEIDELITKIKEDNMGLLQEIDELITKLKDDAHSNHHESEYYYDRGATDDYNLYLGMKRGIDLAVKRLITLRNQHERV